MLLDCKWSLPNWNFTLKLVKKEKKEKTWHVFSWKITGFWHEDLWPRGSLRCAPAYYGLNRVRWSRACEHGHGRKLEISTTGRRGHLRVSCHSDNILLFKLFKMKTQNREILSDSHSHLQDWYMLFGLKHIDLAGLQQQRYRESENHLELWDVVMVVFLPFSCANWCHYYFDLCRDQW